MSTGEIGNSSSYSESTPAETGAKTTKNWVKAQLPTTGVKTEVKKGVQIGSSYRATLLAPTKATTTISAVSNGINPNKAVQENSKRLQPNSKGLQPNQKLQIGYKRSSKISDDGTTATTTPFATTTPLKTSLSDAKIAAISKGLTTQTPKENSGDKLVGANAFASKTTTSQTKTAEKHTSTSASTKMSIAPTKQTPTEKSSDLKMPSFDEFFNAFWKEIPKDVLNKIESGEIKDTTNHEVVRLVLHVYNENPELSGQQLYEAITRALDKYEKGDLNTRPAAVQCARNAIAKEVGMSVPAPIGPTNKAPKEMMSFLKMPTFDVLEQRFVTTLKREVKERYDAGGAFTSRDVLVVIQREYYKQTKEHLSDQQLHDNIEKALEEDVSAHNDHRGAVEHAKEVIKGLFEVVERPPTTVEKIAAKLEAIDTKMNKYQKIEEWRFDGTHFVCRYETKSDPKNAQNEIPRNLKEKLHCDIGIWASKLSTQVRCTIDPYDARVLISETPPPSPGEVLTELNKIGAYEGVSWEFDSGSGMFYFWDQGPMVPQELNHARNYAEKKLMGANQNMKGLVTLELLAATLSGVLLYKER